MVHKACGLFDEDERRCGSGINKSACQRSCQGQGTVLKNLYTRVLRSSSS